MHHLDPFWATQGHFKLSGAFLSHSEPLLNSRRLFESLKTLSVAFLSHFEQLWTCTRTLILSHSEPIKTFLNFFKQFWIYTRSEISRKKARVFAYLRANEMQKSEKNFVRENCEIFAKRFCLFAANPIFNPSWAF